MSWKHKVELYCDECKATFTTKTESVIEAENKASNEGWEEEHGKHYCPRHN